MKTPRQLSMVALALCLTFGSARDAQAWCWCGNTIFLADSGTMVGTKTQVTTKQDVVCSTNALGPCPRIGAIPPNNPVVQCNPKSTTTIKVSWTVTGTANYAAFGVNASTGGSIDVTVDNADPTPLTNWCTCCNKCNYIEWVTTYSAVECGPGVNLAGFTCDTVDPNASYTKFNGFKAELRDCTVPIGLGQCYPTAPPCPADSGS